VCSIVPGASKVIDAGAQLELTSVKDTPSIKLPTDKLPPAVLTASNNINVEDWPAGTVYSPSYNIQSTLVVDIIAWVTASPIVPPILTSATSGTVPLDLPLWATCHLNTSPSLVQNSWYNAWSIADLLAFNSAW